MMSILLSDVTKVYQLGGETVSALAGLTLNVNPGEFTAIMGPSGSGKSTLMNILGCLDRPTSGSYMLDGQEVAKLSDDELAVTRNKKIGFVFQSFNLLPRMTTLQNVALPMVYAGVDKKERTARAEQVLTMVGLKERLNHQPNELSGGQRQRVAIARALINDPTIIMADEPTGNLDTKSGDEVMAIFSELNSQGRTIILVTHEPDIAEYAGRVVHVRDGVIERDEWKVG
ncbi:putative ABC transport system ATP-binding protein [Sporomusaceae bacterium BoRhaA]|nr:putative ABC transport system ATP-binding protein [Pelorhabdus rhamnosifermentans]